jgi:peroxiredoxin
MTGTRLNYGIPDIDLPRLGGGTVNPGDFAGHPLIVIFCPADPSAEARELRQCAERVDDYDGYEAWLITIGREVGASTLESDHPIASAYDPGDMAWAAFKDIAGREADEYDRAEGATFLFGRGGSLQRAWPGCGHGAEVLAELEQRVPEDK